MASRKKQSEGIALLSMYNDEEEDEEMDEAEEEEEVGGELREPRSFEDASMADSDRVVAGDYGRDEVAMSPDPEEKEMDRAGHAIFDTDRQYANVDDSEAENTAKAIEEEEKDVEPLDKFLPPAPKAKCSEELQRKINKFLDYKKSGKSFNAEVRNRKDYRNPDFLLHAVRYQDIDQIGSCFSKDVFDPHGYDKSDYYNEIEADIRRDLDRKEQERKKSQKVEFLSAGIVPGATKINLPVPGVPTGVSVDAIPRDGRQNKKSKWDKVDGDRRNPLPCEVQDPTVAVGVQTAVLSAVNGGVGYMAFVQQRRREAEEKKSNDKKLDLRS